MFIRLKPGQWFSSKTREYPDRQYAALLPISMEKETLTIVREHLSPESWYVYSILLMYESLKYETKTPPLDSIYRNHCNKLTQDQFDNALMELQATYITKDLIPLVQWTQEGL